VTENKNEEGDLVQLIEEFYLPRHLVDAIHEIGHIPAHSQESQVGVGFIDIADYTRLSKFLSPKENQILLNGLYTAFQMVLERHGGFLNKIEGDSMMFHFDDIIDKRLWDLDQNGRTTYIARELFYTCVDMQRVCILFNQAHDDFLEGATSAESRQALMDAFTIIKTLRNKNDISSTLFAFFQIRIRIGANIGEVTIGNFGPSGSKHWDVIGLPVINAKRMESTAPVGGLRISADFFEILDKTGIADDYLKQFRAEAALLGSVYRNIRREELYKFREVILHEKKNATYKTYSVQVYPGLPESLARQTEELLNHGALGVDSIVEFFRYYRGNRYVIDQLERTMESRGVIFRKTEMFALIAPMQSRKIPDGRKISLFTILNYLDRYMDHIQKEADQESALPEFLSFNQYMTAMDEMINRQYDAHRRNILHKTYFTEVVVQLVYSSIEASLREYQLNQEVSEESLEAIEEIP
jgi:class 3 adenylate cyclase